MSGRARATHETRAKRARREFWKRFFIWVFIVVFGFSVAGGIIAFSVAR